MGTLIDILLGFLLFMFTAISLTMVCGWLILQFVGIRKEEECGCQTCECDDKIPMLDRPLTKKELKEVNMKEQNKEYNIMTARDMMTMKTEVTQMASPENMTKSFRGKPYDIKKQNESYDKMIRESEDYIDPLDEDDFEVEEEILNEPLEENDPRPYKK